MKIRSQSEIMADWDLKYKVPLVSIRCITYNQKKYIGQALESFLMQKTDFPFVVIVHDDASTDGTADVIREYEEKYPQIIKPIYEKENLYSKRDGSLTRIMNEACCKSKYCAICEGDDFWIDENKLQIQVNFLETHANYSACAHNVEIIYLNHSWRKTSLMYPTQECVLTTEHFSDVCHVSSLVFHTDVLREWPEFAYKIPTAGDVKLNALLKIRGPIFRLNKVMSAYRKGVPGSWSKRVGGIATAMSNQQKNSKEFFIALKKCSLEDLWPHFDKQINWLDYRILLYSYQLSLVKQKYPVYWKKIPFKGRLHLYFNLLLIKLKKRMCVTK